MNGIVDPAWQAGLAGGVLIGLASLLLMALNGRIAGISGIVGALLSAQPADERRWRLAFIAGLLLAGLLAAAGGGAGGSSGVLTAASVLPEGSGGLWLLAVSGLLVGFGTRLAGGCTSGHGVCGLGRRSLRSLVAVLVFMATAVVTVHVLRHVL